MIDRIGVGNADVVRVWGTHPFTLAAIAIAGMVIVLAAGCAVLGNSSPCDRSQAMRNVLEEATGRDCDLITDEDLADVRSLSLTLSFDDASNLKNGDFSGLENLEPLT